MMAVEVGEPIHQVSQLVLQEPIEVLRETHVGADSDLRRVPFFLFSLFLFCFLFFRLIVTFLFPFLFLSQNGYSLLRCATAMRSPSLTTDLPACMSWCAACAMVCRTSIS